VLHVSHVLHECVADHPCNVMIIFFFLTGFLLLIIIKGLTRFIVASRAEGAGVRRVCIGETLSLGAGGRGRRGYVNGRVDARNFQILSVKVQIYGQL
jgi:hypothetical protein